MICSFIQWRLSDVINGDARLSESLKRHLKHCQKCRFFFQSSVHISAQLSEEALSIHSGVPSGLNERIFSAIEKTSKPTLKHPAYGRILNIKTFAIAACILLFSGFALRFVFVHTEEPAKIQSSPFAELKSIIEDISPSGSKNLYSAQNLPNVIVEPYRKEMVSLAGDTESAVKFLASCIGVNISDRALIPSHLMEKKTEKINQ